MNERVSPTKDPAPFHPYALDVLIEGIGERAARANLAFVMGCARSEEPAMKERIDRFIEESQP